MPLTGIALLPSANLTGRLIDFQRRHADRIGGPRLGTAVNLPHVSIIQCPFSSLMPAEAILQEIVSVAAWDPRTVMTDFGYQPVGWLFAHVAREPWMFGLQEVCRARTEAYLAADEIDRSKDFSGYTPLEKQQYLSTGYRYMGEPYAPHFTVGRTLGDACAADPVMARDYRESLEGTPVVFDRIAVYRAGEHGAFAQALAVLPLPA